MLQWTTTIRKAGNSRVITLPAGLLRETHWSVGEELTLTLTNGHVQINSNKKPSLEELMAKVPEGGLPSIEKLEGLDSPTKAVGREFQFK